MSMRFFGLRPSEVFGGGGGLEDREPRQPPTPPPPPEEELIEIGLPPEERPPGDIFPPEEPIEIGPPPEERPPTNLPGVPPADSSESLIPRGPLPTVPSAGGLTSRGTFARPGRPGFASYRGIRPPSVPEYNPRSAGAGAPFVGGGNPDREDVVEAIMRRLGSR